MFECCNYFFSIIFKKDKGFSTLLCLDLCLSMTKASIKLTLGLTFLKPSLFCDSVSFSEFGVVAVAVVFVVVL